MKILSCEDVVPEDADLEVPGVRHGVGGVDLADDLLGFIWSKVKVELGGSHSAILHVLPVVYVKFSKLAVQLT